MDRDRFAIIIPARYGSSRFPGKPLAKIGGTEMIIHVCRRASAVCPRVLVATDDTRIAGCVQSAGYEAVMTSADHKSGTDRVCEAYRKSAAGAEVVINIQGDEPFIAPGQIEALMQCFDNAATDIATLVRPFDPAAGFEALFDPNVVKVTFGNDMKALCFSRSIIPYVRGVEWKQWLGQTQFYTHVGVYAYRSEVLERITALPQSSLELAEKLEQLRWLQNGYNIRVAITGTPTIGIDTEDDLRRAEEYFRSLQ